MSARLLVGGLELERAVIAFLVFHPQFDGMNVSWSRDTGKAERNTVTWPDILHAPSPVFHMQRTGTEGMRYPLADPGVLLPVPMLEQLRSQGLTDYRAFFQPFGSAVDLRLWPDLPSGRAVREGISVSFATTRADGFGEDERTTLRALASPFDCPGQGGSRAGDGGDPSRHISRGDLGPERDAPGGATRPRSGHPRRYLVQRSARFDRPG